MSKQKNIDKYLDTMGEVYEVCDLMSLVDLAVRYANLVQMAHRLEKEIREAVGYDLYDPDTHKPLITYEVAESAREIASRVINYHLGQFDFDTAVANGLEEDPEE